MSRISLKDTSFTAGSTMPEPTTKFSTSAAEDCSGCLRGPGVQNRAQGGT